MATGIIYSKNTTTDALPNLGYRAIWTTTANVAANTTTLKVEYQCSTLNVNQTTTTKYVILTSLWNVATNSLYFQEQYDTEVMTIDDEWATLKVVTITIPHDANQKAPVLRLRGAIIGYSDRTSGSFEDSQGVDNLLEIPDITYTKAVIQTAPNFTDEDNPTITYINESGNNVDALEAAITATNGTTYFATWRSISKTGTSYTFYLTDAERSAMRAAAVSDVVSVRFYIRTTIGGARYLTFATRQMSIIADVGPTITFNSVADINATTVALTGNTGKMIRGYSTVQYNITATPFKGSDITSFEVRCGSQILTTSSGVFYNAESNNIICTVKDARGNASSKTHVMQTIDYVKVSCNQYAKMLKETDTSAQVRIEIQGNFYNGSFGAKNNTLKIEIRYARNGDPMGAWTDVSALLYEPSGNTYTFGTNVSGLDPSGTYTFQSRVSDPLSSSTSDEYSVSFMPIFDWSQEDFNFNVPVLMNGETVLRHNASANNLVVSASGGFIYFRPGGTSDTSGEIKFSPQGNIELTGDIIINGVSLKSKLGL